MKMMLKALAVWIALAGMAQAIEAAASQERSAESETRITASACEPADTDAAAHSDRFSRAAEVTSRECAKPDWSWED
ncbi:hypothetical protein [Oricola sp.]|uniref:hypothetical protein n=1 Tax=Oricola sp. TaxID=1979950 RepID=UPI003519B2ED